MGEPGVVLRVVAFPHTTLLAFFMRRSSREQVRDGVHGAQGGHLDAGDLRQFHDGGEQYVEFQRLAALQVLERGGAVVADPLGARETPLDGDADLAAEGLGDRQRLGHHRLDDLAGAAVQAHLPHGRAGQRADRVEGDVAEQLDPDVVAQVRLHRTLQTAGPHGLAERQAARRDATVGLADREPGAFQVPYDTRPFELGRRVDHAADGPFGREHRTDRAARVHALDAVAVVGAAVPVEVPPGDAVLGGDHRGGVVEQRLDQRPARRVRVGLQAQENVVDRADLGRVVGGVGAGGEVAARAEHSDAVLPHGRQMRSTGDEVDVGARAVERGADIGADGTGAEYCDFHARELRSVEGYREGDH